MEAPGLSGEALETDCSSMDPGNGCGAVAGSGQSIGARGFADSRGQEF